jgi:hypothetical protein
VGTWESTQSLWPRVIRSLELVILFHQTSSSLELTRRLVPWLLLKHKRCGHDAKITRAHSMGTWDRSPRGPRVPRSLELTRRPLPWELGTTVQPSSPRVPRSLELTRRLVLWELETAVQPTSPRVPRSHKLTRRPVPADQNRPHSALADLFHVNLNRSPTNVATSAKITLAHSPNCSMGTWDRNPIIVATSAKITWAHSPTNSKGTWERSPNNVATSAKIT